MPDENRPGELPPDLPPEYAEAYRRAYERAYREAAGADDTSAYDPLNPDDQAPPEPAAAGDAGEVPERTQVTGPLFADEVGDQPAPQQHPAPRHAGPADIGSDDTAPQPAVPSAGPAPQADAEHTQVLSGLVLSTEPEPGPAYDDPADRTPPERPAWLVPALLAGAAVLLVLAAFIVGKVFSSTVAADSGSGQGGSIVMGGPNAPKGKAYSGSVQAVAIRHVSASCQERDGVDSGGNLVSYRPSNAADGDLATAWRCYGNGVGRRLTLRLPPGTEVAELGLVPGYAKTDPVSGADRYAENNRVTKVRWELGNGRSVVQTFNGSATDRRMQTMRIPPTKSDRVVVEILATTRGPRNTTAISEVRIARPATNGG